MTTSEISKALRSMASQIVSRRSPSRDMFEEAANELDELDRLRDAIKDHHAQKADDRCWEDDLKLYLAAGLPPCDRRVGDKAAMLSNCARFIDRRCEGGHWPTYVELEERLAAEKELGQECKELLFDIDPDFQHMSVSEGITTLATKCSGLQERIRELEAKISDLETPIGQPAANPAKPKDK